jgi:hypothetical protein
MKQPMIVYRQSDDTTSRSVERLIQLIDTIPEKLREIPAEIFATPPAPGKWSKKQIIGHLIDSATNNHQRFVRGQFEDKPAIGYDQVKWNDYSYYQQMDGHQVIAFWENYNRFIVELITRIPPSLLSRECTMSDGSTWTIAWLFDDYVRHMEHHLGQIFEK